MILAPPNTVGGVDQRGGAPGTAETNVLAPENMVEMVNAIVLSGGSAFGLASRDGVMTYLREKKIGFPTGAGVVPIVSAAILFDLGVGTNPEVTPDDDCGYRAATVAAGGVVAEGSVGAGAGATVGKFAGAGRAMKGGIGTASVRGDDGLVIGALIAVNASGSIFDRRTGRVIAGVRTPDGAGLENPFDLIRRMTPPSREMENTTIGVVATNAKLTKAQALRVAIMAQDGLARAMFPSHTPSDGDTLFVLATGQLDGPPNVSRIGSLGAEAVSDAILNAVIKAKGLPNYPSVADIKR